MLPFVVCKCFSFVLGFGNRLNTKGKAYPVRILTDMFKSGLIIIEFFTVKSIGVQYVVIMQMSFVKVRCNYYLTIIAKSLCCIRVSLQTLRMAKSLCAQKPMGAASPAVC